jgi:hypothetical protein
MKERETMTTTEAALDPIAAGAVEETARMHDAMMNRIGGMVSTSESIAILVLAASVTAASNRAAERTKDADA